MSCPEDSTFQKHSLCSGEQDGVCLIRERRAHQGASHSEPAGALLGRP